MFPLSLTRTKPSLFYIFIKYDVLLYSNMTTLVTTPDIDCRKFKKDYGNSVKNQHDWRDWLDQHQLEYKYQNIIRKDYLHHYHPIRAYDLSKILRHHFLGWEAISLIMKHLINNNKYVEVDKLDQEDERKFHLYLVPRFSVNIQVPFGLLDMSYYDELKKFKDTHNKDPQY